MEFFNNSIISLYYKTLFECRILGTRKYCDEVSDNAYSL
ncbi:hypothetical protein LEP1GSC042_2404 [Leptospira kirschneri serovar Bim str. PUO 1247]|nr:hypothetical protein LEP1GSC042_2404 [Leptospira kirschneri serovar Bim str. PUO 1247]